MGKVSAAILGSICGGLAAVCAVVLWFGWGLPLEGQAAYSNPIRADYVDLLLTVVTIILGAIGLAITVGAVVIGLVALKTLREIKDDAANEAKDAAAGKINETMAAELEPNVDAKVREALPIALKTLLENETGHNVMTELARAGVLDDAVGRAMAQLNYGGPVMDPADVVEGGDQD